MKINNYEVEPFLNILFDLKLKGKSSRMRTRLVKQLDEYLQGTINAERNELIKSYSLKDENNEIVLNEEKTGTILVEETASEFYAELESLMNEAYIIEESESNREILLSVADSFLNCDIEFSGQDANLYDLYCEQFEEVIEKYSKEG